MVVINIENKVKMCLEMNYEFQYSVVTVLSMEITCVIFVNFLVTQFVTAISTMHQC